MNIRGVVLLDMDDTLLINDFDQFLPHYMRLLGTELAPWCDPQRMVREVLNGTQRMAANLDPTLTLEKVFDGVFYPHLDLDKTQLQPILHEFYSVKFNQLSHLTSQITGVADFINNLRRDGYLLAVATNPLFPLAAIHTRLSWAGFSPPFKQFRLISAYEDFHFAKPNPEFIAECLARLGWPPVSTIMVGNSQTEDIEPARQLGLAVFHVHPHARHSDRQGLLDSGDFIRQNHPPFEEYISPRGMLAILRSTAALIAWMSGNPDTHSRQEKLPKIMASINQNDVQLLKTFEPSSPSAAIPETSPRPGEEKFFTYRKMVIERADDLLSRGELSIGSNQYKLLLNTAQHDIALIRELDPAGIRGT